MVKKGGQTDGRTNGHQQVYICAESQIKIEVNTLNINRESSPLELGQIELLNPGSMTYKTN